MFLYCFHLVTIYLFVVFNTALPYYPCNIPATPSKVFIFIILMWHFFHIYTFFGICPLLLCSMVMWLWRIVCKCILLFLDFSIIEVSCQGRFLLRSWWCQRDKQIKLLSDSKEVHRSCKPKVEKYQVIVLKLQNSSNNELKVLA